MNDLNLPILLAEFLLKSAIIVALGFVMMAIMKKASPAAKHSLWFQIFSAGLIIPILLIAVPRWQVIPNLKTLEPPVTSTPSKSTDLIFASAGEGETISNAQPAQPTKSSVSISSWLSLVWLSGVIALSLQSLLGLALLIRINRRATSPSSKFQKTFDEISQTGNHRQRPTLLISADIKTPFTWGIFRPTILLPTKASQWSQPDLEMILLHELSHIERRDAIAVLISRLFLSLNWVNPLAWLAINRSVQHRETDCDLKVIGRGHSATSYAEMLFNQAKISSNNPARHCATAVAENGTIEQRIKMILNTKSKHRQHSFYTKAATALLITTIFMIGVMGNSEEKQENKAIAEKADPSPIEKKLKDIRVPSLELNDTPLEDAIAFMQQKSIELDSEPDANSKGFNIVIAPGVKRDTPITLRLTNVPLGEAIRYITALAGAQYRVDVHAVVVEPGVNNTATVSHKHVNAVKIASNQKKLDTIRIPSLEFADTPLPDALHFLQQKSVELDSNEQDVLQKGINVILSGAKGFDAKEKQITLKLTNVPLGVAFKYTCELSGCEYTVDSHAIIIKPMIK